MKKVSLVIILAFIFLLHVGCDKPNNQPLYRDLMPFEAKELIDRNRENTDFVIIDIRTPGEFSDGHVMGAINIDYYAPDYKSKLDALDKNNSYLIYCRSANRSARSLSVFKELEFKRIYHMLKGFNGWKKAGLPVAK